jgi:primary-amine oxidase
MHSHVLAFKADFDIKGRKNTFEKTAIVSKAVEYPWSKKPRNTMKLERSLIENEDDGKINWPSNGASIYSVINLDKPNKYGEYPGYRISKLHNVQLRVRANIFSAGIWNSCASSD